MKTLLTLLACSLLISLHAQQADTLKPVSKIKAATVYFEGAEVEREVSVKLAKGRHILQIDQLPTSLDPDRIQAKTSEGMEIIAVTSDRYQRLNEQGKTAKKRLEDRIQALEDESNRVRSRAKALKMEEKLLLDNINLSRNDKGSAVADIREGADFYKQRLNAIYTQELQASIDLRSIQDSLRLVFQSLNKVVASSSQPQSAVYITVVCEKAVDTKLGLKYFVQAAGWLPMYDFRVEDISKPLELVYNAQVFQSTGEDWGQVKLSFSSANPSISGTAPDLEKWYINKPAQNSSVQKSTGFGTLKGKVVDADSGEPLPFVEISLKSNNRIVAGVSTDIDGNYTLKPIQVGNYVLEVSYVGYQPLGQNITIQSDKITFMNISMQQGTQLTAIEIKEYQVPLIVMDGGSSGGIVRTDDIAKMPGRSSSSKAATVGGVSVRGGREEQVYTFIDGVKVRGLPANYGDIYLDLENAPLALTSTAITFEVDQLFTIPSNGKDLLIAIKKEQIKADYVYIATPKLDKDVFLVARVPKWSELQLLSGNSSIYYQGTYTGDAYINSAVTKDTLEISLGRDASITTQRVADKMVNDKRTLGSNIKQTVGWELSVRNNKALPILVEIVDQYPLSEVKSIEIEQLGHGDAKLDKDTGKLIWTKTIASGSTEKVKFSYELKYPVGQVRTQ